MLGQQLVDDNGFFLENVKGASTGIGVDLEEFWGTHGER